MLGFQVEGGSALRREVGWSLLWQGLRLHKLLVKNVVFGGVWEHLARGLCLGRLLGRYRPLPGAQLAVKHVQTPLVACFLLLLVLVLDFKLPFLHRVVLAHALDPLVLEDQLSSGPYFT